MRWMKTFCNVKVNTGLKTFAHIIDDRYIWFPISSGSAVYNFMVIMVYSTVYCTVSKPHSHLSASPSFLSQPASKTRSEIQISWELRPQTENTTWWSCCLFVKNKLEQEKSFYRKKSWNRVYIKIQSYFIAISDMIFCLYCNKQN